MAKDLPKGCIRGLAIGVGGLFLLLAGMMAIDYFWGDQIPFLRDMRSERKQELKLYLQYAGPPGYDSALISEIVDAYSVAADSGSLDGDHYWRVMNAMIEAGSDDIITPEEAVVALELMREVTDTSRHSRINSESLPPLQGVDSAAAESP